MLGRIGMAAEDRECVQSKRASDYKTGWGVGLSDATAADAEEDKDHRTKTAATPISRPGMSPYIPTRIEVCDLS